MDFEGTLVLERLAEAGCVEAFWDAVDADDFTAARRLMEQAGLDAQTVASTLQKMRDADGDP